MTPPPTSCIALGGRTRVRGIGAALNEAGDCDAGYTLDICVEGAMVPLVSAPPPPHPAKIATANAVRSTRKYGFEIEMDPTRDAEIDMECEGQLYILVSLAGKRALFKSKA
jgi:hypothetical protein